MTDNGTGTVQPDNGTLVYIPPGHSYYVFAVTDDPADDGAAIIDNVEAHHRVVTGIDEGEDG